MGFRLRLLPGDYAVARMDPDAALPGWADGPGFVSISRSDDELSVLCQSERVPPLIRHETGWACMKLVGPFAFDQTGVVLSVIRPLSEAGIGIFVVSTFDGDHLMVKRTDLDRARVLLSDAGHRIEDQAGSASPFNS